MGLKQRGKRQYFYRNENRDGVRKTVYVGRGIAADLAVAAESEERKRTKADREETLSCVQRYALLDRCLGELSRWSELLVRAELLRQNFHQHDRGRWRRRKIHD